MRVALALLSLISLVFGQSKVETRELVSSYDSPFRKASALAVGVSGLIYIVDTGHNRLVAIDSVGSIILESSQGGSEGELRWPVDVTVGAGGRIYVCDSGNRRIVEYTRLLEWKGELTPADIDGTALEPRLAAASTVGDIFVFESDNGQLLRYDSFFKVIARLGGQTGKTISNPISMTYSTALGLLWTDREGMIYRCDEFLSDPRKYRMIPTAQKFWQIASVDSVVYAVGDSHIFRQSGSTIDSLVWSDVLSGVNRPAEIRIKSAADGTLYLLNSKRGSLVSLYWP